MTGNSVGIEVILCEAEAFSHEWPERCGLGQTRQPTRIPSLEQPGIPHPEFCRGVPVAVLHRVRNQSEFIDLSETSEVGDVHTKGRQNVLHPPQRVQVSARRRWLW